MPKKKPAPDRYIGKVVTARREGPFQGQQLTVIAFYPDGYPQSKYWLPVYEMQAPDGRTFVCDCSGLRNEVERQEREAAYAAQTPQGH